MYTIRKKFKFEMAHQLFDAYSDCCKDTIHGHSYILEVFIENDQLDQTGMLIDFTKVKDQIKEYINKWDHALVMPNTFSQEYIDMLYKYNMKLIIVKYNPTAENMAKDIYEYIASKIWNVSKVRLHETDTGYAEYYEPDRVI